VEVTVVPDCSAETLLRATLRTVKQALNFSRTDPRASAKIRGCRRAECRVASAA
jgi:hypothetical protein